MKRQDYLALGLALQGVKNLKGAKFSYAVAKTSRLVQAESKILAEVVAPDAKFTEYDIVRAATAAAHAKKDEAGNPIQLPIAGSQEMRYDIEDQAKFDLALKALQEKNKEVVDEQETKVNEYNAMLEEEMDGEIHKIKMSDIPEDITPAQLDSIMEMIDDSK